MVTVLPPYYVAAMSDDVQEEIRQKVIARLTEAGECTPYAPTLAELTKLLSVFLRFSIKAFLDSSKKSCEKIVSLSGSNIA